MSQQQHAQQQQAEGQKITKTKEERAKEKECTNAWLKKQQEKKKKKLEQQQKPIELDQKALEKAKRKQQKRLERQQMLKEQGSAQDNSAETKIKPTQQKKQSEKVNEVKPNNNPKKSEEKVSENKDSNIPLKKNNKKGGESSTKLQQAALLQQIQQKPQKTQQLEAAKPVYTELLTLQQHLICSYPKSSSINKSQQSQLINKYLDQYVNENDTILVLSRSDSWKPLASRCGKRVFLYPIHKQFQKCEQCENIVCTYEDVAYLMEGTLTKIFVELDVVFANGTGLTQKGNQNIIVLAKEFKIPVIGFSGTWNLNGWNFLSRQMFINKYGQDCGQKYDIIQNNEYQIIVLQIGSIIPRQMSGHLEILSKIYRGCDLHSLKW